MEKHHMGGGGFGIFVGRVNFSWFLEPFCRKENSKKKYTYVPGDTWMM